MPGCFRSVVPRTPARAATQCMQAARWRLIKSPVGVYRRQILSAMCDADLLGCASASHASRALTLLRVEHAQLQSELLRLVSTLASDAIGRAYLLGNARHLIVAVFNVLQAAPMAKVKARAGATYLAKS